MSAFYSDRGLTAPASEESPETIRECRDTLRRLHTAGTPWRLIGQGQHVRHAAWTASPPEEAVAIRTTAMNRVIEINRASGILRVEAGITYGELIDVAREEGFSLQRYGLHPASATVGGLLCRFRPGPPELRAGDLLDGCVGLGAHDPDADDYRYLVAPRKASGPDLRYHFLGREGRHGALLDVALVLWKPQAQRLLIFDDLPLADTSSLMTRLFRAGIRPGFVHYSLASSTLQLGLVGPGQLLHSRAKWIETVFPEPAETLVGDDVSRRKAWLQARHPDRRTQPQAAATRVAWFTPAALQEDPETLLGPVADVEIPSWTSQRIEAFLRYDPADLLAARAHTFPPGTTWAAWWQRP